MVLDQVRFKRQRLSFTVGDDELNVTDLTRHQADPWRQIMSAAEITPNTTAKTL